LGVHQNLAQLLGVTNEFFFGQPKAGQLGDVTDVFTGERLGHAEKIESKKRTVCASTRWASLSRVATW
jgi:hypothetical protein